MVDPIDTLSVSSTPSTKQKIIMNHILDFISPQILDAIGAALLHSIWQIALIAGALALALYLLRNAAPSLRYAVCTAALALMAMLPLATGVQLYITEALPLMNHSASLTTGTAIPNTQIPNTQIPGAQIPGAQISGTQTPKFLHFLAPLRPIAALLWLLGVVFFSIRLAGGLFMIARLRRHSTQISDGPIDATYRGLLDRMGLAAPARLHVSPDTDQPMLVGWVKPVILLPASMLTGIHPGHVEAILAHELAHIRRHDYLISVLQSVAETLLFYHPAVWWVSNRIRIEREYCCDDAAISVLDDRSTYAQALAGLELHRVAPKLAPGVGGGRLVDRIRRIVDRRPHDQTSWAPLIATFFACSLLFVACEKAAFVTADQELEAIEYEIPEPLKQMIASNDIEGTITYLHELRENNHPDAFVLSKAAYSTAPEEELRRNIVYVFAHFNSIESDKFLISIAKNGRSHAEKWNALRSFEMRQPDKSAFGREVRELIRRQQNGELFEYPEISDEQMEAVKSDLIQIMLAPDEDVHSIKTSALRALQRGIGVVDRSVLEEVIAGTSDTRLIVTALMYLDDKQEAVNRIANLYDPNLDDAGQRIITSGIGQFGHPDGVPLLLDILSRESVDPKFMPFSATGALYTLLRILSPADRQAAIPLIEAARSSYSSDDYRFEQLAKTLDYIEHLRNNPD